MAHSPTALIDEAAPTHLRRLRTRLPDGSNRVLGPIIDIFRIGDLVQYRNLARCGCTADPHRTSIVIGREFEGNAHHARHVGIDCLFVLSAVSGVKTGSGSSPTPTWAWSFSWIRAHRRPDRVHNLFASEHTADVLAELPP